MSEKVRNAPRDDLDHRLQGLITVWMPEVTLHVTQRTETVIMIPEGSGCGPMAMSSNVPHPTATAAITLPQVADRLAQQSPAISGASVVSCE